MKTTLKLLMAGVALLATTGLAQAEGVLNIFNWGNYTNPEVIKKFEETHKVKVTITDYDSNDTALAKVRAGGHGFDMVVPSGNFMPIWISEGLLLETRPDQMENFKNVDPAWVNVPYDPGRHYSVPWQWGTVGVVVNTKAYKGDINTWGIVFNPPDELKGKVNLVPEMNDVIDAAIKYNGGTHCTDGQGSAEESPRHAAQCQAELGVDGILHHRQDGEGRFPGHQRLERVGHAPAPAEPGHQIWLSQGRLPDLDGQSSRYSRMPRMWKMPSYSRISSWILRMRRDFRPLPATRNGIMGSDKYYAGRHEGCAGTDNPEGDGGAL